MDTGTGGLGLGFNADRAESSQRAGFTLVELLVVIGIIALLIGMLLPVLAGARESARGISCATQIRNLALAGEMYASESREHYPERAGNLPVSRWPTRFLPYFQTIEVLKCPTEIDPPGNPGMAIEGDRPPRSYIFNGFNDMSPVQPWNDITDTFSMSRVLMKAPGEVILWGEKEHDYRGYYTDIYALVGDDYAKVEEGRHGNGSADGDDTGSGYSNYCFGDLSVRTLRKFESYQPVQLWAVRPDVRNQAYAPPGG